MKEGERPDKITRQQRGEMLRRSDVTSWMKRWFSSKYEICWKSIETEAVFTKSEMNEERNVDFLQNTRYVGKV